MLRLITKEDRAAYKAAMIPPGAVKVTPKGVAVEFYLYQSGNGYPASMCFIGSAARPAWRYWDKTPAAREARIKSQIESIRASEAAKAKRKAEQEKPTTLEPGAILKASWGYDQTNVDFYKVLEKKGSRTLILQKLATIDATRAGAPDMTGKCLPDEAFAHGSKPFTARAIYGESVRIGGHYASRWNGLPADWTAYA